MKTALGFGAIAILFGGTLLYGQQQQPGREGCGRADPAYVQTANESGGIPMFLQPSEVAQSFHLIRESTRNNVSTVLWANRSLGMQPETIDIPVDSLTQRATFTFSFETEGTRLSLTSPSGKAIVAGQANTEVTELHCGRIVTATSPEAGTWHAVIAGRGKFWVEAKAQSELHIVSAEFVKVGGRPGHEGLFRIEGQPLAGRPATIRASVSTAKAKTVEFSLVNESGGDVQRLDLKLESTGDMNEYAGTVQIPDVPFRIAVSGIDANNARYQRFYASLFHSESVEVSWNRGPDELSAGTTTQASFTIRNPGAPRSFRITVTDAHHFVTRAEPHEMTLGSGESRTILVDLRVPAGTQPGTGDDIVVVAASTSGASTSNASVVHYSVVP